MSVETPNIDEVELLEDIEAIKSRRDEPTEPLKDFLEALEPTLNED